MFRRFNHHMPLSTFWLFFSIPLAKVAIIGDFTTDNGPFIDDRLMVFVLYDGGEWFEASMYAYGMRSFHELVSNAIGSSMIAGLASSVDFTNRTFGPWSLWIIRCSRGIPYHPPVFLAAPNRALRRKFPTSSHLLRFQQFIQAIARWSRSRSPRNNNLTPPAPE